jgi:predicted dehydrogenase
MANMRAGVAGAGSMGRNHARIYSLLEGVELTAVYDADAERAAAVVAEFGGRAVSTLEELAASCDLVSVAVPTVAHREVGCLLMEKGVHVLIEKPIAATVADARALVETSKRCEKLLAVGHVERFNPVLKQLENRLTKPRFIEAHRLSPFPNRSMDIGVVLDLMIHDLEVILHLVKSPVVSIDAVGVSVLTSKEDIANARIRFENGCVANVTASRISPERMRKIRVFQEDCYLSLDYQQQEGQMYAKVDTGIAKFDVEIEKGEPLLGELQSFVDAVARGETPAVTGQQGMAALELALKVTELARSEMVRG